MEKNYLSLFYQKDALKWYSKQELTTRIQQAVTDDKNKNFVSAIESYIKANNTLEYSISFEINDKKKVSTLSTIQYSKGNFARNDQNLQKQSSFSPR